MSSHALYIGMLYHCFHAVDGIDDTMKYPLNLMYHKLAGIACNVSIIKSILVLFWHIFAHVQHILNNWENDQIQPITHNYAISRIYTHITVSQKFTRIGPVLPQQSGEYCIRYEHWIKLSNRLSNYMPTGAEIHTCHTWPGQNQSNSISTLLLR